MHYSYFKSVRRCFLSERLSNFMKSKMHVAGYVITAVIPAFILMNSAVALSGEKTEPFPTYPCIESNIAFWKKVYGTYSTSQGIIHDRRNLDIIYEIVPLKDPRSPGAAKYNGKKVDNTRKKYERLLKRLASDREPQTKEEKRVYGLFTRQGAQKILKDAYRHVRFQLGQKDRFRQGVVRSGAYFEEIQRIFKQYGLPADLAYLPHVESSFDYDAYSKFGAAGIWQFTRGTGQRFMTIDYTVDERRDPLRATHAAARLLKENYEALGSWPMAVTAYNHGTNGMLKAKRAHGDYETILRCYDGRTFGFASRNFYSEFLAAREIAKNYQAYFGDLQKAAPIRRHSMTLPGHMAVQDVARLFRVGEETIREFNPALRAPVYNGQKYVPKGYMLHLPENAADSEYAAEIPAHLLKARQKPSRFYRVRRGDTAGAIARKHGVDMNDLIMANGLNSRATIYAGQNLRIPVPGEKIILASRSKSPAGTTAVVNNAQKPSKAPSSKTPLPASTPTAASVPAEPATPAPEPTQVAQAPQLPASEITSEATEEIAEVNPWVVVGNFSVLKVFTRNGKTVGLIQVEPEETLGHYADWLQIPTQRIRNLNRFSFHRSIVVGQKLEIPLGETSPELFEEKRYEYHKEMEEDFFAVYVVKKTESYLIQSGDNIWTLCQEKFDLPLWLVKKYNSEMDFSRLTPSQTLVIPIVSKTGDDLESEIAEANGLEDDSSKAPENSVSHAPQNER